MATIGYSGGQKLQEVLEAIAEKAGRARDVSVGFMAGSTYPDGTPVAMVAAIQNYGAPAMNIPPRPFFSNMVKDKSPNWGVSLGNLLENNGYDASIALKAMGQGISGQLQESINLTDSPPLAPATIKAKGFDKPLVDTGVMLRSVLYSVDEE